MTPQELVKGPAESSGLGYNNTHLQDANQEESTVPGNGAVQRRQVTLPGSAASKGAHPLRGR